MTDKPTPPDITHLVADHHAELYRYAFRLTGSATDAEDLTQQTFLRAQANLTQLRDPKCARSWLFTILRNCYQMDRRKKSRGSEEAWGDNIECLPEETETTDVDAELLQDALDALPDEFRTVLLLYYFEDYSYREIAAELDLPVGTVMSRLSRAKARLRSRLFAREGQTQNSPASDNGQPRTQTQSWTTKNA